MKLCCGVAGSSSGLTDSGVLHLQNVTAGDGGKYGCSVTNHITTDTVVSPWSTRLVVQKASEQRLKGPEFLLKPKALVMVPKGEFVVFGACSSE